MLNECWTTMPSVDLQKICRDMSNIGEDVVIARKKDTLPSPVTGVLQSRRQTLSVKSQLRHVEGTYSLKYINLFTKATNMCSIVQIMQEESNRFLILKP